MKLLRTLAVLAAFGLLLTACPADEPGDDTVIDDDAGTASASVDRLLAEGVDAIVGAAASGMSLAVIDKITGAEVVQYQQRLMVHEATYGGIAFTEEQPTPCQPFPQRRAGPRTSCGRCGET